MVWLRYKFRFTVKVPMSQKYKQTFIYLMLILMLLSSCTPAATQPPTSVPAPASTSAVTVLDLSQPNAVAPAEAASQPEDTATPTDEPTPTSTPEPTPTPIPVVVETSTASGCTNQAEFIKHLNISDFTSIKASKSFAKIWLVKNVGTCTWTTSYKLVFISGDPMGSSPEIFMPHEVLPGETVDLRIDFFSPDSGDYYENSWMFQDEAGNFFGVGSDSAQPLMVKINVPVEVISHKKRL